DRRADGRRAQLGAVRVGEGDVDAAAVEVGLGPSRGTVHQLVGHRDGAGAPVRAQAADRAGREHPSHAERAQRPHVGQVRQGVRGVFVLLAVTRNEGDRPARHVADGDGRARLAVGGVDVDLVRLGVEEIVEAGAADDGQGGTGKLAHDRSFFPRTRPGAPRPGHLAPPPGRPARSRVLVATEHAGGDRAGDGVEEVRVSRARSGVWLTVASGLAFASSGPLAKAVLAAQWSPGAILAVRLTGAAAVVLVVAALADLRELRESPRHVRTIAAFGVVAVAGVQATFFLSLQHLQVGV